MAVRGIRGAIVVSVIFTVTPDLYAEYPAKAARSLGWTQVPLLCVQEMGVSGSLERCIRVLLHWNTDLNQEEVKHVYLGKAACLRPDLVSR
jgi:chorismate mutase